MSFGIITHQSFHLISNSIKSIRWYHFLFLSLPHLFFIYHELLHQFIGLNFVTFPYEELQYFGRIHVLRLFPVLVHQRNHGRTLVFARGYPFPDGARFDRLRKIYLIEGYLA